MIIRATQQLMRLAGIQPVKNTEEPTLPFPGEWYASQVTRFDGSFTAIHFLHNPTRISVLVPGPFLDQSITGLRDRIEDLEFEDIFRTGKKLMDISIPARILRELMAKQS